MEYGRWSKKSERRESADNHGHSLLFITASRQRGEVDRVQEYQVLDSPQPVTAMMDRKSPGWGGDIRNT